VGTARNRLKQWPLKPSERAAMRAAQQQVEHMLREGMTAEQRAQARAALDVPSNPRQSSLALQVKR
jgi:hypothetical protein